MEIFESQGMILNWYRRYCRMLMMETPRNFRCLGQNLPSPMLLLADTTSRPGSFEIDNCAADYPYSVEYALCVHESIQPKWMTSHLPPPPQWRLWTPPPYGLSRCYSTTKSNPIRCTLLSGRSFFVGILNFFTDDHDDKPDVVLEMMKIHQRTWGLPVVYLDI